MRSYTRWARPLGPRRERGTNPRSAGTDLRSRLESPRALGWPRNERFQRAAWFAAQAPLGPAEPPKAPQAHKRTRELVPVPYGSVSDSDWRRRAAATSGPCVACNDTYWIELDDEAGAVLCTDRVTPAAELAEPDPDEPP